jgi:SAM-dependent methyltransferase
MADWYDDDTFWETFRDYMFNPTRLEQTRAEVDQLVALLKLRSGVPVLDLGCGIGRHSLEFARRGFTVTGVDRTARYLEQARDAAARENLNVEFVHSDMRAFVRREAFDGALSMFTSFGYFEDAADDLRVARNVYESLRPGAKLTIDINGKEVVAAKFRERDWNRRADGNHRDRGTASARWMVKTRITLDPAARHRTARIHARGAAVLGRRAEQVTQGSRFPRSCDSRQPGRNSLRP